MPSVPDTSVNRPPNTELVVRSGGFVLAKVSMKRTTKLAKFARCPAPRA